MCNFLKIKAFRVEGLRIELRTYVAVLSFKEFLKFWLSRLGLRRLPVSRGFDEGLCFSVVAAG